MSANTIEYLKLELVAKAATVRNEDEGRRFVKEMVERLARDCAETTFLQAHGRSENSVRDIYDEILIGLLAATRSTLIDNGSGHPHFLDEVIVWSGNAFHTRFMELDANRDGAVQ
jgi:ethanolamine ammonia-lyase small subunit